MGGRDNTGDYHDDPGNQLAGLDFKLKLYPLIDLPVSLYGQMVGKTKLTSSHRKTPLWVVSKATTPYGASH
ncbi:hypothetical protein AB6G21_07330 [Providencia hangzhouensis]